MQSAKVYVFVDGFFANNKDLNSQIGFVLVIGIELEGVAEFILIGNIIYTSLMKCKKVTCIMLTLELYIIIAKVDMLITLSSTINIIINKFGIKQLPIVVCIDSFLLYECIIKLGIIKKKRLIIDIILIH